MNKLGFHIEATVGTVPGTGQSLGAWLVEAIRKVQPPVVLVIDPSRGLLQDIRRFSPDTFVVGRLGQESTRVDEWLGQPDPEKAGRDFAQRVLDVDIALAREQPGKHGSLLVNAWMSLCEKIPGPNALSYLHGSPAERQEHEERWRRYDDFQVGFRNRLQEADGELEAVAFNFGAGNFSSAEHYLKAFPRTLKTYKYLGFHEYGWPALSRKVHPKAVSSAGDYHDVMVGVRKAYGKSKMAIITEFGLTRMHRDITAGDVGWLSDPVPPASPEALSQEEFWRSLEWYNGQLQYNYVLGACLYSVALGQKWESFRFFGLDREQREIRIVDWIAERLVSTPPGEGPSEPAAPVQPSEPPSAPATQPQPGAAAVPAEPVLVPQQPGKWKDANIAAFVERGLIEIVEGGTEFKLDEIMWMSPQESGNRGMIFLDVVDREGKRMAGQRVEVRWPGGAVQVPIEEKPGELWGGSFGMGGTIGWFSVRVQTQQGSSDAVTGLGLGTPAEPHAYHRASFGLRFRCLIS